MFRPHLCTLETTMFQLRSFIHQRLHTAAEEILGEVEKMLALCEVDVQRAKQKPDNERPKLECLQQISEVPSTNSVETGEQTSTQEESYLSVADVPGFCQSYAQNCFVQMGFRIKEEQEEREVDSETQEVIFPSPAAVKKEHDLPETQPSVEEESNMSKDEVQGPSKASEGRCCLQIDFGMEEHADESGTKEAVLHLVEAVKRERNQQETNVCDKMQPVSSDGSETESDGSDEKWVNRKGTQKKTKRQNPAGNDFAKSKTDCRVCPSCGKGFRFIHHFRKHIKTHTKTSDAQMELLSGLQNAHSKKLVCDVCNKTFTATAGLLIHLKSHAGMKDFKCQDCGKRYLQKEQLNVHMRTHSGERRYDCDVCGRRFYTLGHLKSHEERFSGRKLCCCDICGERFCQRVQLTRHRVTCMKS